MERDEQVHGHAPEATPGATPEAGSAPESPPDSAPPAEATATPTSGADADAGVDPGDLEGHHLLELWSDREEIHALPEILRPAEGLVAVGSGTVVRSGRLAQSKWLVVLTDRRLLCIRGRAAVTRKVIDMPVSQIRGVETKGLFRKTLSLDTGYGTLRISGVKKGVASEMVEGLTALMGAYSDDGGEQKATAIPRADLSKAGTAAGHTHEELHVLEEAVDRLEGTIEELTGRVEFLEELVRSNVASRAEDTDLG